MSIIPPIVNGFQDQAENRQLPEICALGHSLGDCPARRAGCNNHYQLLHFMYPPLSALIHVRETMGSDPAVKKWLNNLDAVLPGQRPTRQGVR